MIALLNKEQFVKYCMKRDWMPRFMHEAWREHTLTSTFTWSGATVNAGPEITVNQYRFDEIGPYFVNRGGPNSSRRSWWERMMSWIDAWWAR